MLTQLVKITVDMGGLAKDYTKGGQYIQIKVGDSKPAFYAIASAPSPEKPLEIIVKNQGDTAEKLCDSKPGTTHYPCCCAHTASPAAAGELT
jgi:NAD(P)H-flavin reductase